MSSPDIDEAENVIEAKGREVRHDLWQTMLSGVALTIPFLITLVILGWVINMVLNALTPLENLFVALGLIEGISTLVVKGIAAFFVVGVIFVVGLAAQYGPNTGVDRRITILMKDLPGLGSIYTSVERMSDVLLKSDTRSFQEVKLVEFPSERSFALAFLTAETPPVVEDAAECEEMLTVFVPLAPNPVMGGHLLNLPRDRVHDIDISVEEAVESIMTTGIAIDEHAREGAA